MDETMEAIVLTAPGEIGPQRLPIPPIGPEEVLVRVFATGICGSDLAVYRGTHPYKEPPIVLGHELAGRVERVGDAVRALRPGDRVCAASFSHCESCPACRSGRQHLCRDKATLCAAGWNGSFAEYVVLRQNMAFPLPDGVGWQAGALVEPLSIGLHAVRLAARAAGPRLAILGSGNIGLCCLIVARRLGLSVVCTDVRPEAGETALELGAEAFVDSRREAPAEAVAAAFGGNRADAVIVAADYPGACDDAVAIAAPGGVAVLVSYFQGATSLPLNALVAGELSLTGSALSTPADIETVLAWLAAGEIEPRALIAHAPPLAAAAAAMELMDSGAGRRGKVVVDVAGAAAEAGHG